MKKRYHINNIFFQFLSSYLLLLIFPTIFSIVFYQQSVVMAKEAEIKSSLISLQQVQNNFESDLDSCNTLAVKLKNDMYKINMTSFKKPEPGSPNLYKFIQDARQFTDRYAFDGSKLLQPMVLMKNGDMVFINNSVIYGMEFFYNYSLSYSGMDYETWRDTIFTLKQPMFMPSQDMRIDSANTRALTYVYPLFTIENTQDSCIMQFILYEKDMQKVLSMANVDNNGTIYLMQLDGVQLGWQGEKYLNIPLDVSKMELDNGTLTQNYKGENYFIIYSKSDSKNFLLASVVPESVVFTKAIKIKYTMLFAILVYLIIGFAGCLSFAQRNSKPIKNLTNNINALVKNEQQSFLPDVIKNDYDYLKHGIYKLAEKADMTTRNAQENYLIHIFTGSDQAKSILLQMGKELGIDLEKASCFSVAVIQLGDEQRDFLYSVLFKYKENVLSAEDEKGDLLFCTTEDFQVAVLFLSSYDNHEVWSMKVLFDLYSEFSEKVRIGLGKAYHNIMDIQFSYTQAYYTVTNGKQEGKERILTYEKMENTYNLLFYPIDLEYKLINWVKSGNTNELDEAFELIHYQNFCCKKLTPRMLKLLIDNIQVTLLKIYDENGMNESYEELVSQLNREVDYNEKFGILKEKFMALSAVLSNRKNHRSQNQKQKFLSYIDERYGDSMLCVAEIARKFDLSESYFSQLFRELTGDTFSTYLENLRIKKACELLSKSKMAEIEEITQEVGYNNSNTFRRAFKRVMGVAPSSYKSGAIMEKNENEDLL